ncbi:MAG TPA: acetyl-CoA carboxylase biotin carboxylase subunit, partial [Hyphomonadaceae bacterium]
MKGDVSTLLVANRGEIALRIMRTARRMGLRTVAVYSDADANAPHVKFADDAVRIGPGPVGESYLSIENIIAAAKSSGATAIHPGYGFLSENAKFAKAVEKAGLTFVGPPPAAIDAMGDKARAKRKMIESGVPCVPGYEGEDQSAKAFANAAAKVGYPVMIKAAAGGGGRGMRIVEKAGDLETALKTARSEAQNAFGNGDLILEKAIVRPRHVEIQVFADSHGAVIHLGERDCSVQRRHQKVIEEAPCPVMTPDLRERMGAAAVEAARAVDYVGAGTVEFLLDESDAFYFLEMNTRLQVEHPVTEMVTGIDLVALQLRVARGEALGIAQHDVTLNGHAIEVRLYAEDPEAGFLPSSGHVHLFHAPTDEGVRVDAGVETAGDVSAFYDPMLAKIVAHGATRDEARRRLISALSSTAVFGPRTNR